MKIFKIIFLYSVEGARCGSRRKFAADWRIFKQCKKISENARTVYRRVVVKGLSAKNRQKIPIPRKSSPESKSRVMEPS